MEKQTYSKHSTIEAAQEMKEQLDIRNPEYNARVEPIGEDARFGYAVIIGK